MSDKSLVSAQEAQNMLDGKKTIDVGRLIDTVQALWSRVNKVNQTELPDPYWRVRRDIEVEGYEPRDGGNLVPMANDQCSTCGGSLVIEGWQKKSNIAIGKQYRAVIRCTVCDLAKEV